MRLLVHGAVRAAIKAAMKKSFRCTADVFHAISLSMVTVHNKVNHIYVSGSLRSEPDPISLAAHINFCSGSVC